MSVCECVYAMTTNQRNEGKEPLDSSLRYLWFDSYLQSNVFEIQFVLFFSRRNAIHETVDILQCVSYHGMGNQDRMRANTNGLSQYSVAGMWKKLCVFITASSLWKKNHSIVQNFDEIVFIDGADGKKLNDKNGSTIQYQRIKLVGKVCCN